MAIPTLSGRVIPAQLVRMQSPPAPHRHEALEVATSPSGPQITLIREGATVIAIEVRCTCGQVTRLDCQY